MLEVFGAITDPFIAEVMQARIKALNKEMQDNVFGELHLTRSQILALVVECTFDQLHGRVVPAGEDILELFDTNLANMRADLPKKINTEVAKKSRQQINDLEAVVANIKREILQQQQQQPYTRQTAVPPGPRTPPNATQANPEEYRPGGPRAPLKPSDAYPTKPAGLEYPGQPCFSWICNYCTTGDGAKCSKGRPHDWGDSTPLQKSTTIAYAKLVKPHNIYNIWKAWCEHDCVPANFPHRITNE